MVDKYRCRLFSGKLGGKENSLPLLGEGGRGGRLCNIFVERWVVVNPDMGGNHVEENKSDF